jgi:hypothetical protein
MLLLAILQNDVGLEPFEFVINEPTLSLSVCSSAAHIQNITCSTFFEMGPSNKRNLLVNLLEFTVQKSNRKGLIIKQKIIFKSSYLT